MGVEARSAVTALIEAARQGGAPERERLYAAVYDELKQIARRTPYIGREGDTLQATVLVSEVFVEFERRFPPPPKEMKESRATFYRSVGLAMRTILRDHWRAKCAEKRGGARPPSPVEEADAVVDDDLAAREEFLAVDAALDRLEAYNRRWYDVVMNRYFAGRTIRETADLLSIAPSTVTADWKLARSWLAQECDRGKL